MSIAVKFGTKRAADRFRDEHPEHVCPDDDRRLRSVQFKDRTPQWLIDRAEAATFEETAQQASIEGKPSELSDREKESLARQHRNWSWQQHGIEAMWAKGALQAWGATDWMDFYEPGEGARGALNNLQRSKSRSVELGAHIGVGGEHRDVDPDDPEVMRQRAPQVAEMSGEECNHAEGHCRRGDPDACDFLGEACGFSEAEIDAIVGFESEEAADIEDVDVPFTGPQFGALKRSWGGYMGAIQDLEVALADVKEAEQHATDAFEAVNAIRADAGQDLLEPERLTELREMDLAEVCDRGGVGYPIDQLELAA